ncbi:class I SAM-dependent methyltransferase [Oceanivirga salmonicida]|uniref:class I SAM-dependent methyltransferase n=1 Tax=Oceanivirga salmonicida TaxID=1769291 RepID=UPI00082BAB59
MRKFMTKKEKLIKEWLEEEKNAYIKGWDFSYIEGRFDEESDLPWDYTDIIRKYLKKEHKLLDIDTGGGEFLIYLGHSYGNTSATENYEPNVEFCKKELLPLGIDFKKANALDKLPFEDNTFDIIINRHGAFNASEIYRILKKGGIFITQQVGAENDRELIDLLLPNTKIQFPEQYLGKVSKKFKNIGFNILQEQEVFRPIKFYDIGALVWFACIIEWEFINFSVEKCLDKLFEAQDILENKGVVEAKIHRFLLVCKK